MYYAYVDIYVYLSFSVYLPYADYSILCSVAAEFGLRVQETICLTGACSVKSSRMKIGFLPASALENTSAQKWQCDIILAAKVYYATFASRVFNEAVDRFSDFFAEPLFNRKFVEKEVHAIDSGLAAPLSPKPFCTEAPQVSCQDRQQIQKL